MDVEQLSCVVDGLPPAKLRLRAKMEKVLSLLKDSLGSTGCFFAQFWARDKRGFLENLPYPHLCVPNSTLLAYRLLEGRQGLSRPDILERAWLDGFPEWTSNVSYYRPDEYAHLSDAIACGVRGIIAFPVFEPYQPINFGAVLELVTIEEKQDFDLEKEKVVQALQAADLWTQLPRPRCFNDVQRAALTEIADVTIAKNHSSGNEARKPRCQLVDSQTRVYGSADLAALSWSLGGLCRPQSRSLSRAVLEPWGAFADPGAAISKPRRPVSICNYSFHRPKLNVHILWEYHFSQFVFVFHICSSKEGKPGSSLVSTDVRFDSPGKQMSKYLAGPFTVSKPTSPEDLKLIQYVFDSSLSESETIVQCKNYHLSRRELYSLRPETWLDDNVLSTISDAMTLVKRKMEDSVNWYLPIVFAENADDPSKCISFAKKHRIKENYMSDLLCCEKAFVPVFDKERSHFFLFVLQLKRQVVEIWDSIAASSQSDWVDRRLRNLLVSLDALFKDDIHQNYQNVWSFTDFRVERPSNVPQQPNGYDCGVYVIKFMLAPEEVTSPDFLFDSDNERLEVVLRLLASDVNSCRNNLASKAEAYYEQRFGNHREFLARNENMKDVNHQYERKYSDNLWEFNI
ncbi:hypothetical protein H0E87_028852 [Populus deltoides]|uniref:Ubiquitin-like protease family profile domain-containing protein n=1 Tax=Populus deltoides TaxID=3696 RepID=A0A8T2WX99_POPDE|nr:hypothetical protein H0E87_028852 [Populus deltoides]